MNRTVTIVSTLALGAALGMAVGSGMLNFRRTLRTRR